MLEGLRARSICDGAPENEYAVDNDLNGPELLVVGRCDGVGFGP
jgi:hypothetical protein